jgi:hypothetical protein
MCSTAAVRPEERRPACHPELCLRRAELFEFAGGPREPMQIHMPGLDAMTAGGFYKRLKVIFYYECEIVSGAQYSTGIIRNAVAIYA